MDGRVKRLHGSVGEMRRFIDRLNDLAAFTEGPLDITIVARIDHRAIERIAIELGKLRAVGIAGLADFPFGLEQGERFLGAPEAIGNDRDGVLQLDDLHYAAPAFYGRIVDAFELAAKHRTSGDRGIDHARYLSVDGKFGRAVDFERRIEASNPLADQLELIGRTNGRFFVKGDLGCITRERTVVETSPRLFVRDFAVRRFAFRCRNLPALRRSSDQPLARAGAGLQEHLP